MRQNDVEFDFYDFVTSAPGTQNNGSIEATKLDPMRPGILPVDEAINIGWVRTNQSESERIDQGPHPMGTFASSPRRRISFSEQADTQT